MLSRTAIAQYERDGYCFPLDILTPAEAADCRARLEAHEHRTGGPLKGHMRHKSHLLFPWLMSGSTLPGRPGVTTIWRSRWRGPAIATIVVPKVEGSGDLAFIDRLLKGLEAAPEPAEYTLDSGPRRDRHRPSQCGRDCSQFLAARWL